MFQIYLHHRCHHRSLIRILRHRLPHFHHRPPRRLQLHSHLFSIFWLGLVPCPIMQQIEEIETRVSYDSLEELAWRETLYNSTCSHLTQLV